MKQHTPLLLIYSSSSQPASQPTRPDRNLDLEPSPESAAASFAVARRALVPGRFGSRLPEGAPSGEMFLRERERMRLGMTRVPVAVSVPWDEEEVDDDEDTNDGRVREWNFRIERREGRKWSEVKGRDMDHERV